MPFLVDENDYFCQYCNKKMKLNNKYKHDKSKSHNLIMNLQNNDKHESKNENNINNEIYNNLNKDDILLFKKYFSKSIHLDSFSFSDSISYYSSNKSNEKSKSFTS